VNSGYLIKLALMENFFAYLERLETLGFFSGYPLVFALVLVIAGAKEQRRGLRERLVRMLPYAYALTGTLYLGMILRNAWPDLDMENLFTSLQQPWLRIWALISILFWIPLFARTPLLSLLHSLLFFYFIVRDIVLYSTGQADKHLVRNDMKVYGDSLLIILAAFFLLTALASLYSGYREQQRRRQV
jgi:hypothetical protein